MATHHLAAPHLGASHAGDSHAADSHAGGSHAGDSHAGAPHYMVPISALAMPPDPLVNQRMMRTKYNFAALVLLILQLIGLIIALSLWQTGNEVAAIGFLCITYYSSYVLKMLGSFLQTGPPNLEIEVKFNELRYQFLELKYLLIVQFACIYLQRAIVSDLWLFGIATPVFVIRAVLFIRSCWQLYKAKAVPNNFYLFTLIICTVCCFLAQIGFFIAFAITYGTTTKVESKLPMGALFVPIFFGLIANIVMIVMTKNWEVEEITGTEV